MIEPNALIPSPKLTRTPEHEQYRPKYYLLKVLNPKNTVFSNHQGSSHMKKWIFFKIAENEIIDNFGHG